MNPIIYKHKNKRVEKMVNYVILDNNVVYKTIMAKELDLIKCMGCHLWDADKNFYEKELAVQTIYTTIGNKPKDLWDAMIDVIQDNVESEKKCYLLMTLAEAIDRLNRNDSVETFAQH